MIKELILCFIISFLLGFFIERKIKRIQQKKIDDAVYIELNQLNQQKQELNNEIIKIQSDKIIQENSLLNLEEKKTLIAENISDLEQQASKAATVFFDEKLKLAQTNLSISLEEEENRYQEQIQNYKEEYLNTLKSLTEEFKNKICNNKIEIDELNSDIELLQQQLFDLRSKVESAIESDKKALLEEEKQNYYKCLITDLDIKEIKELRQIEPYFRNSRPICKVIWETYYKDACDKLIARLTSGKNITGIYKITNLVNNKSYIGQAVQISERLKNHIKAGIGIDPPNNPMYKDMKDIGVENFLFEIVQECPATKLNDLEKFWIEHYQTQTWGYNVTKGGSQSR